jgi:MoaA/NifB/PqqE/SkfB family radical SAM enzyme
MSTVTGLKNTIPLTRILFSNPQMLKVSPSLLRYFSGYMNKFQIQNIGNNLILHSHLPPLNSRAYSRFVNQHLLAKTQGPSHAQIAVTNACPQNCEYCYNKNRTGKVMDTVTIKKAAIELKEMGVTWLGLTGGEPLLNKNLIEIVDSVSVDCAVKLFTTGCTLTPGVARDLKNAGVFSVSVSLDHWIEEKHDSGRRYKGAYKSALKAIDIFQKIDGLHVGVSAVLSREMIRNRQSEEFLDFLKGLGLHEAWLSEVKPSVSAFQEDNLVITEDDRLNLANLQDEYNRNGKMTVNYLGHFEGRECFGCNAGHKMVYIDAFGEVSPCVFTPLSFGNVQQESIQPIFTEMKSHFPSEDRCFLNKNYRLLQKYSHGENTISRSETLKMMQEVKFGQLSKFFQLYYKSSRQPVETGVPVSGRAVRVSL